MTVWGSQTLENGCRPRRSPSRASIRPTRRRRSAARKIAVWDGHNYAVEVVDQLGLADSGGVVRAGISRYVEQPDVDRLLAAVAELAR